MLKKFENIIKEQRTGADWRKSTAEDLGCSCGSTVSCVDSRKSINEGVCFVLRNLAVFSVCYTCFCRK